MLDLLVWAFWFIFGAYSFWVFTQAKTYEPLTLDHLALSWKLHKQQTGCKASHLDSLLTKHDGVVGFKCDCGYEFVQKRLITQKVHRYTPTTIIPVKTSKVAGPEQKTKASLQNLGLRYSYIKEIYS